MIYAHSLKGFMCLFQFQFQPPPPDITNKLVRQSITYEVPTMLMTSPGVFTDKPEPSHTF